MTQSPSMMHIGVNPAQQQMAQQHIGAQQMLMGPPQQPMMNGTGPGIYHTPRLAHNIPQNTGGSHHGTPNGTPATIQGQGSQQMNASPNGRPASSNGMTPSGSQGNPNQHRPQSSLGTGAAPFPMPPPSQPSGPSSGKRKSTMDTSSNADATPSDSQGPPTRRQRTAGSVSNGNSVTFVDGPSGSSSSATEPSPKETTVNTRARGRKSPVQTKAPPPAKGKRRGTGA